MEACSEYIELATTVDMKAVRSFYNAVGYVCELSSGDRLLVGTVQGEIIAAVRLCGEEGVLVLRGMYVAEGRRRRGVGAKLLGFASTEIGSTECWCVPHDYLVRFYSSIGFRVCESGSAPPFLVDRQVRYTQEGRAVTIMRRPAE